jgi:hypothetical protein
MWWWFFSDRNCSLPPPEGFGHIRHWNNSLPHNFNTKVKYTCQEAMRLQDGITGELYDAQELTCGWDIRWHPAEEVKILLL